MLQPRDPPHYLATLKTTTTPKRLLWLDCASTTSREQGAYVQRWRAGALGRTWHTSKRGDRRDTITTHDTPTGLWADADEFCKSNRRVVLWAYDLALQLRVSQGLVHLPALGWHLEKIVLERTAAWALLRNGSRTLIMCDLKSWTPVTLAKLAADVLGGNQDDRAILAGPDLHTERCKLHINVVRGAVMQTLDWIATENLGPFRPTGSGQSYAAYRRSFLSHNLLVHDNVEQLHAERLAMWTGRCEAWQHGQLLSGPYVEYDMTAAYCRIAAECELPAISRGETRTRDIGKLLALTDTDAVLAHVTVKTDVPVLPARMGGRTLWPVGEFSTWIWDPELRLAAAYCQDVTVHRVYRYSRAPVLRDFAKFVLAGLNDQTQTYGPVPARVMKHWSRCLVGRLGLRYRAWLPFGSSPTPDLQLVTYIDCDDETSTDVLCAGRDRLILADMSESVDSLPQIPSWVMSECRRRLWQFMEYAGFSAVAYVDTDSVIIDPYRGAQLQTGRDGDTLGMWARKGTYKRLTVHGPRNYSTERDRHVSGLPLTARQTAPLEFTGQIMRSIKESMRNGELDCVASIPRKFVLDAPDMRRQHMPNHQTAPFRVQLPQEDF